MNTRLKTVVSLALVVVLSAGLAMAGREAAAVAMGRRWRRMPRGGGGGSRPAVAEAADSTPAAVADTTRLLSAPRVRVSAVTPRQSFNTVEFRADASVSAIVVAECRGQPRGYYAGQSAGHRRAAWNCQHAQLGQPP